MTNSKNILVPFDFSNASKKALLFAISIQKTIDGKIIILHVAKDKSACTEIDEKIKKFILEGKLSAAFLTIIVSGNLTDSILAVQKKNNVGLIVMGTLGASTFGRKLTGTNTYAVINKTNCPVVVIPEDAKLNTIKTVVLATDNHSNYLEQASGAVEFVKKLNATLLVMHINPTLDRIAEVDYKLSDVPHKITKYIEYSKLEMHVSSHKDIRKGIESFVEKHHADLLIMVTHHRSLFNSIFEKSETKQMIQYSNLPMLIIPSLKV